MSESQEFEIYATAIGTTALLPLVIMWVFVVTHIDIPSVIVHTLSFESSRIIVGTIALAVLTFVYRVWQHERAHTDSPSPFIYGTIGVALVAVLMLAVTSIEATTGAPRPRMAETTVCGLGMCLPLLLIYIAGARRRRISGAGLSPKSH